MKFNNELAFYACTILNIVICVISIIRQEHLSMFPVSILTMQVIVLIVFYITRKKTNKGSEEP